MIPCVVTVMCGSQFMLWAHVSKGSLQLSDRLQNQNAQQAPAKKSITNLKNGENLRLNFCHSQPVAKHYVIGQKLGISGTPAIISQDGELYPGYFSPKDLLDKLKS